MIISGQKLFILSSTEKISDYWNEEKTNLPTNGDEDMNTTIEKR